MFDDEMRALEDKRDVAVATGRYEELPALEAARHKQWADLVAEVKADEARRRERAEREVVLA